MTPGSPGVIHGRAFRAFVYAARTLRATAAPSATKTKSSSNFFTMTSSAGWWRHCIGGAATRRAQAFDVVALT
jgi:hypothetical protein